jgi:hypothetical protein
MNLDLYILILVHHQGLKLILPGLLRIWIPNPSLISLSLLAYATFSIVRPRRTTLKLLKRVLSFLRYLRRLSGQILTILKRGLEWSCLKIWEILIHEVASCSRILRGNKRIKVGIKLWEPKIHGWVLGGWLREVETSGWWLSRACGKKVWKSLWNKIGLISSKTVISLKLMLRIQELLRLRSNIKACTVRWLLVVMLVARGRVASRILS